MPTRLDSIVEPSEAEALPMTDHPSLETPWCVQARTLPYCPAHNRPPIAGDALVRASTHPTLLDYGDLFLYFPAVWSHSYRRIRRRSIAWRARTHS